MGAMNLNLGLGHLDERQIFVRLREMQERFGWDHPATTNVITGIQARMKPDSLPDREFEGFPAIKWGTPPAKDEGKFSSFARGDVSDPPRDGDDGVGG